MKSCVVIGRYYIRLFHSNSHTSSLPDDLHISSAHSSIYIRPAINAHIAESYEEVQRLEQEIDDLLLEKIQSGC